MYKIMATGRFRTGNNLFIRSVFATHPDVFHDGVVKEITVLIDIGDKIGKLRRTQLTDIFSAD